MDKENNPLFKHSPNEWRTIGAMLGCDCMPNMPSCGFATMFNKDLPYLITWDLDEVKSVFREKTRFTMTQEHKRLLSQSISLLTHCPVIYNNNKLHPLNELSNDLSDLQWGILVGFGASPKVVLKVNDDECGEAVNFNGCSFNTPDGSALPKHDVTTHDDDRDGVPSGTKLPTHALIDFNVVPMRCFLTMMLQKYVASRIVNSRKITFNE